MTTPQDSRPRPYYVTRAECVVKHAPKSADSVPGLFTSLLDALGGFKRKNKKP